MKVFSSLVPALLAKNFRIEVWEQLAGSSTWTRRLSASPGNVEAIIADISSGATFIFVVRTATQRFNLYPQIDENPFA